MSQSLQLLGSNRSAILSTSSWYSVCAVQYFRVFKTNKNLSNPIFKYPAFMLLKLIHALWLWLCKGSKQEKVIDFQIAKFLTHLRMFFNWEFLNDYSHLERASQPCFWGCFEGAGGTLERPLTCVGHWEGWLGPWPAAQLLSARPS